ncbi:MAG: hypothetical protein QNJ85_14845 [Gammaproteobacteria bacterium]|nr:hypothetical protein [Gammaproteobacteria bacterium]
MLRIISICICCFILGCSETIDSEDGNLIIASACAKKLSDGSIVECDPSSKPVGKYGSIILKVVKINKSFPGPEDPLTRGISKDQLHQVKEISVGGGIRLENGILLKLAGLKCESEEATRYLEDVFLNRHKAKLYFQLTGYELNQYKYAYIWGVYLNSDEQDSEISSAITPNEHVLIEGWCQPIPQENHRFHERYKRVAALGE